ncbi:MAG TPA: DUF1186 domain-containing protein [Planctomycetaceae bacterium]|nr:DUF1186 domain-containing protein [Planctomycetaceae bacterium]
MSQETKSLEIAETSPADDLDEIIRALDEGFGKLPKKAILAARENRERIIPRLIQTIEEATANIAAGNEVPGNAHFFALFLLTEFGAREAFPAILKAIKLPADGADDLFGDAITSYLNLVIATLSPDPLATIETLLADDEINEYVRWEAAQTYLMLVRDGILTREEAIERLRGHLRTAIANEDYEMASALVSELLEYAPHEALDDIREAFRLDLIDPFFVSLEDVEHSVSDGLERFEKALARCRSAESLDTIETLKHWASFSEKSEIRLPSPQSHALAESEFRDREFEDELRPFPATTIRNTTPKVGRNDPCPCGSGKKFKKCCGQV